MLWSVFVECHLLDRGINAEHYVWSYSCLSHKLLCVYLSSSLWLTLVFSEPLGVSVVTPLSSSVSEHLFLPSLFFLVPPCSLIKARLGSQLMEPAGEQRRRCSSSWNSAPHSSSSSSWVTRTSSLSPFLSTLIFLISSFSDFWDSALRLWHWNFLF